MPARVITLLLVSLPLCAQQTELVLNIVPGGGSHSIALDFVKSGPSLWTARAPGEVPISLRAAEGGGYLASADDSAPTLLEAGGFVDFQILRDRRTLPYRLVYSRRSNGGEDFLWSPRWHGESELPAGCSAGKLLVFDSNVDGILDHRDLPSALAGARSATRPFPACGAQWILTDINPGSPGVTLARLDAPPCRIGEPCSLPDLTDLGGRPIGWRSPRLLLLDVWASWCGPCLDAIHTLKELASLFPGLQVVGINVDEAKDRKNVVEIAGRYRLPWSVAARGLGDLDPLWRSLAADGASLTLPLYAVIGPDDVLHYVGDGGPGLSELQAVVRRLSGSAR